MLHKIMVVVHKYDNFYVVRYVITGIYSASDFILLITMISSRYSLIYVIYIHSSVLISKCLLYISAIHFLIMRLKQQWTPGNV